MIARRHSRVKVFKREMQPYDESAGYKYATVDDGEATFLEFGVNYEEFESGAGNFSTAIIMRDDGTIDMVQATMIQFIEEGVERSTGSPDGH